MMDMHKRTHCMPYHETAVETRERPVGPHRWSGAVRDRARRPLEQSGPSTVQTRDPPAPGQPVGV
jgi:hypothetical protein